MTEQEFKIRATENTKQMINYFANREYEKLPTVTKIDSSWCRDGKTQMEGIKELVERIEEMLEDWFETEGKELAIDPFDERYFDVNDLKDGRAFGMYSPDYKGEALDFWFTIDFMVDEADTLTSVFDIDI